MLVEHHGRFILRIDDQSENGRIGTGGAAGGIYDERAAEALSAETLIDSQATDQSGGKQGIARQALCLSGGRSESGKLADAKV